MKQIIEQISNFSVNKKEANADQEILDNIFKKSIAV